MDTQQLERAFTGLGLDFRALFPDTGPYEDHEWLVKTIPRVGLIVNAVPPEAGSASLPWEEWYKLEGPAASPRALPAETAPPRRGLRRPGPRRRAPSAHLGQELVRHRGPGHEPGAPAPPLDRPMASYILAHDLGTTGDKATLFSPEDGSGGQRVLRRTRPISPSPAGPSRSRSCTGRPSAAPRGCCWKKAGVAAGRGRRRGLLRPDDGRPARGPAGPGPAQLDHLGGPALHGPGRDAGRADRRRPGLPHQRSPPERLLFRDQDHVDQGARARRLQARAQVPARQGLPGLPPDRRPAHGLFRRLRHEPAGHHGPAVVPGGAGGGGHRRRQAPRHRGVHASHGQGRRRGRGRQRPAGRHPRGQRRRRRGLRHLRRRGGERGAGLHLPGHLHLDGRGLHQAHPGPRQAHLHLLPLPEGPVLSRRNHAGRRRLLPVAAQHPGGHRGRRPPGRRAPMPTTC